MCASQPNGHQNKKPRAFDVVYDYTKRIAKDYYAKAMTYYVSWWTDSADYSTNPEYQRAQEFRRTFTPQEDTDYSWACEYAEKQYEHFQEKFKNLDDKANNIIQNLGGGTGLVALGSLVAINKQNAVFVVFLLPALFCAFWAIRLAIATRRPAKTDAPPPVTGAVQYIEQYGGDARTIFIGQWHQACEGLAHAVHQKSQKVKKASDWYLGTLGLLFAAVAVGAIYYMFFAPATPLVAPIPVKIVP